MLAVVLAPVEKAVSSNHLNRLVDYASICCILHMVPNAFTVKVIYHKCIVPYSRIFLYL